MKTSMLLSPQEWAEQTFGSVQVGDQRPGKRVVQMAARIAHDPAGSLPAQMQDHAMLEAASRLLHGPDVTDEQLIAPHVQQTREEARKTQRVLLIQDTTEVDYQQYPTTSGLGPIGKENAHQGFLVQSVLAVVPQSRAVLGLASQEPFLRKRAPAGETDWQRQFRERESQVWERAVQAIGIPPAGVQWIHVGDRGSEMFPLLSLCRQQQCDARGACRPGSLRGSAGGARADPCGASFAPQSPSRPTAQGALAASVCGGPQLGQPG